METSKLTLTHLQHYMDAGLKFISELDKPDHEYGKTRIHTANGVVELFGDYCLNAKEINDAYPIHHCKLLLYPLSDFMSVNSPAMNELGIDIPDMIEICDLANKQIGLSSVSFGTIQAMAKAKIDFQNIIPQGLSIDVNTIENNPYS